MTQKQAFVAVGGILGSVLLLPILAGEIAGVGSEARAYSGRLATATALGLDPGFKTLIARDEAKPVAARRAFDELESFLKDARRFDLPKPGAVLASTKSRTPTSAELRRDLRRVANLARAAEGGSHRDWAHGYALVLPSYATMTTAAKAADALSLASGARGEWTAATEPLLDVAEMWRAYGDEPVTIGDYVRTASASILFRSAGRLLATPSYPVEEARRIGAMAEGPALGPGPTAREIVIMEATAMHDLLGDRKSIESASTWTTPSSNDLTLSARVPQIRQAWRSDGLRLANDLLAKLPTNPYDYDGVRRALLANETAVNRPRGLSGRFLQVVGSAFHPGWVDSAQKREATRRVLAFAAGLRAGEPEAALRKRLGRLALDPYDGKPLRVRPAPETPAWLLAAPSLPVAPRLFAVYSIGMNGKDDGGRAAKKADEGDLVLVVPR